MTANITKIERSITVTVNMTTRNVSATISRQRGPKGDDGEDGTGGGGSGLTYDATEGELQAEVEGTTYAFPARIIQ